MFAMSSSYTTYDFPCTLEDFSGPFELLLSLAAKEEIDTRRILIAEVISQFTKQQSESVEETATFTMQAAYLHILKSYALIREQIPHPEPLEADSDLKNIFASFEQLNKAQNLAQLLHQKQTIQKNLSFRPRQPLPKPTLETTTRVSIQDLTLCFQKLIAKTTPQSKELLPDDISFDLERELLIELLKHETPFPSLFEELSRVHQITRFLILLELLKQGEVTLFIKDEIIYIHAQ